LRAGQAVDEPQQSGDGSGSNQRRLTLSSWAVVSQVLRLRRDETTVLDLLGFLDWVGDSNLERIVRQLPPLPCRAGCAFCCYVGPSRPDLLPIELYRIIAFLRRQDGTEALADVQARLRDNAYGSGIAKPPCLFLSQERCLVYPVRPLRCRAQHSPDRAACERYYLGRQPAMPLLRDPALLFKSLQIGVRMGMREIGLQDNRLALDSALRLALLEQPDALEEWLKGRSTFNAAALSEESNEGEHLRQLQQQPKSEVRTEARRLSKVVASLIEQPGAWTLYSTTGKVPLS
jgi:hypothetical protein